VFKILKLIDSPPYYGITHQNPTYNILQEQQALDLGTKKKKNEQVLFPNFGVDFVSQIY
jgi:hypothetical protein